MIQVKQKEDVTIRFSGDSDADLALNKQIRQETKQNHSARTNYGIVGSGL
jgi:hypothetical protein